MQYLLSASEMKQWDKNTIEQFHMPAMVLMERAALKVVEAILENRLELSRVLVLCGSGNNGGDGIAVARLLAQRGIKTDVYFPGNREKASEETRRQMKIAEQYGLKMNTTLQSETYTVIVDALFGIGLSREIEGRFREALQEMEAIQEKGAKVVAVDMPSGIHSDTGQVMGIALKADITVTFAGPKLGQIFYPGAVYCGKLVVADIGITEASLEEKPLAFTYDEKDLKKLPQRLPDGNKGTFGKTLVIAGGQEMSGAAYFSACAALRSGAGMVRIYTGEKNRQALQSLLPEAILTTYEENDRTFVRLEECLSWADNVILGPGLGQEEQAQALSQKVLQENKKPCLIDADGLNLLAKMPDRMPFSFPVLITPHMGEMARLTGKSIEELKKNPAEAAKQYAKENRLVCVLKDARTVVAWGAEAYYVNTSGNCGMATAGSGDVLTGVIAALLGQGMAMEEGAALGVYLHGLAGDAARAEKGAAGMIAGDILEGISRVRK